MTRFERILLHVPRLRDLVRQRDEAAGHCARLQRELTESLAREQALAEELREAGREAAAREQALKQALRAARPGAGGIHEQMRDDWDDRARSGAMYMIATGSGAGTAEEFFASGEENVREQILTDMDNICRGMRPEEMRIVEIGCGAGRLTRALSAIFGEVHAVDVSPEMIRLARENLAGRSNVYLYVNNGAELSGLPDAAFHFVFSYIVFQHIPERAVIESYVREAHRVLVPGGLFKFQVEGGPASDRPCGDTWHGVSFSEAELRDLAARCGFEARYLEGAGTQYFWAWFFRR
jgi:SAM-dependent methyltransferase